MPILKMDLEGRINGRENNEIGLDGKIGKNSTSFGSALRKISFWEWVKIAAVNSASAALSGGLLGYGALNVITTTASFLTANYLLNRKKGFTKKSIQTDLNLGGPYTYVTYKLFEILNRITNPILWAGSYALSLIPFTAVTNAIKYHIGEYSPLSYIKGLFKGEPIKDLKYIAKESVTESVKSGTQAAKWLTLPVALSHYLLPQELLIAFLYPIRAAYRYIIGRKPKDEVGNFATSMRYAMPQST
ncbi:hypothetical protein HYS31_07755 [Candidatus Woesearchaeota archaeon]|nr:hypothetical protein [Candidatus Woesearchaeota archaeon]